MYFEYALIEELVINYFVIFSVGKIINDKSKIKYLGVGCLTLISLIIPLFNFVIWQKLLLETLMLFIISIICFKAKNFLLPFLLLCFVDFIFMSIEYFIEWMWLRLLVSTIIYLVWGLIYKVLSKKKTMKNFLTSVSIIDKGVEVETKGYYDSGNLLYDPITQQPICLISYEIFSELYDIDLMKIFTKKIEVDRLKNSHYIDVNSAVGNGKMLVFNVEEIVIHNREEDIVFENQCVGLSMKFEKPMNSKVLLHSSHI